MSDSVYKGFRPRIPPEKGGYGLGRVRGRVSCNLFFAYATGIDCLF
jgi:hypothetical protein